MTNKEMYETFKSAGAPVEEGMTQAEMKEVWSKYKGEVDKPIDLVELYKNGKSYMVQPHDVEKCLASGMTKEK